MRVVTTVTPLRNASTIAGRVAVGAHPRPGRRAATDAGDAREDDGQPRKLLPFHRPLRQAEPAEMVDGEGKDALAEQGKRRDGPKRSHGRTRSL